MIKTIDFKTAFYKEDLFTKFKIKQDDTVRFNVTIEDAPNNFYYSGARILLRRSDKTVIYEEINVTKQDKTFSFKAPNGTTNISGTVYGELEFLDGNNSSGSTFVFVFDVVSRAGNITEAIESKDEIFIIDEIRAFIAQTKEDLKLLDTNTKELQKQQKVLDTKMNETTERVNELIFEVERRDLNVQELKNENERAENNIDDLRELNIEAQQLRDNTINDITNLKNNAINDIDALANNSIENITNLKVSAIEEIEDLKDDAIFDIEYSRDEVLGNIEEAKTDFINTSTEAKNELNGVVDEAKNIAGELEEKIQTGTEVISTINTSVELAEETKMALDNSKNNGEQIKEILDEKILGANNVNEALENIIPIAENIKELLLRTIEEGNIKIPELNNLLSSLSGIEELLRGLNEEANNNIDELNTLNPEADTRIETLRALIEEAKKYETIVINFIASQGGGVDLSEIHQALETLNGYIEDINNRFNDYYTKAEVDVLIEDKTGTIAGSLLPAPYATEPGNPLGDDLYFKVRAKGKDNNYYIGYGNYVDNRYPSYLNNNNYLYINTQSKNSYVYKYVESSNTWAQVSIHYIVVNDVNNVYTNNLDIPYHFNDPQSGQIWKEALDLDGEKPEIDFNNAVKYKRYKVNVSERDEILNAPVEGELKGLLIVDKASSDISQMLITDNETYTRVNIGGVWTEWKASGGNVDLSNIYTKEEVNNLVNNIDISSYKGKIGEEKHPEFYKNCPEIAEDEEHYIRYYDALQNKYKCVYVKKGCFEKAYISGPGAKRHTVTLKATTGRKYTVYYYNETTGIWELITGNSDGNLINDESYIYINSTIEGYGIYSSSFDIETSSSDSTVFIGAVAGDPYSGVLGTYNVEKEGSYIVEHREAVEGCYSDSFNGVMIITNADNNIYQELISLDGSVRVYRLKAGGQWTEWKEIGGKVDLSNIYTKDEVYTKEETYTKEEIDEIFTTGKITGGAGAIFDELPADTFKDYPENPDASTYLWEMKCTHYNHHMIFYFNTDPSGKIGIVEKSNEKLGFKLLDSTFTYKNYKGYFRKASSSTGSWTAFTNDNHFTSTSSRDINAIYYYNFDIMNGNNPEEVYLYGNPGVVEDAITDFNKAIEYKEYIVDIKPGTTASNSPEEPYIKGILKVSNIEGIVHQTLEIEDKTYKRIFNETWSKWYLLREVDIPDVDMSNIYTKEEVDNKVLSVTPKVGTLTADTTTVTENVETDFNKAHKCSMYNVRQVSNVIPNSPVSGTMYGVLKVSNVKALIHQTLETTSGRTFKRMLNGNWTAWKEITSSGTSGGVDNGVVDNINSQINDINAKINELKIPIPDKLNTYTYTNSDGMPEIYKWFDINGFKIMWIDVKLSENEYNSGSTGAMMKTLSFPAQAQIFNNIIMANIASYNRDGGTSTLSRVVQNAEIISKTSVRGRWRHTDNTYPRIDRFTIMCVGL